MIICIICRFVYIYAYMYIYIYIYICIYIYAYILQIELLLFLDYPIVDHPTSSERKKKTNVLVCVTFLMKN